MNLQIEIHLRRNKKVIEKKGGDRVKNGGMFCLYLFKVVVFFQMGGKS